jgi:hypothetical protein
MANNTQGSAISSSLDRAQEALLKQMPESLKPIALEGYDLLREATGAFILNHYHVGRLCATALADEHKHGHESQRSLAAFWDLSEVKLGRLRQFAQAYDEAYVKDWSARPFKRGLADQSRFLTLTHWLLITERLETSKEREKMLGTVIRDSLGSPALLSLLQNAERRRAAGGGRKFRKPQSTVHGLQEFSKNCQKLLRWEQEIFDPVLEAMEAIGPAKVDDDLLASAEAAAQSARDAAERLTATRRGLEEGIKRLRKIAPEAKAKEEAPAEKPAAKANSRPAAKGPKTASRPAAKAPAQAPAEEAEDEFGEPVGVGARKKR